MKTFAWFFILLFSLAAIIPKADISHLGRIGNLYAHFSTHHSESDSNSGWELFLDFISEHYGDSAHEHDSEHQHDHLPFKDFTTSSWLIESPFNASMLIAPTRDANLNIHFNLYQPIGFRSAIDHPPSV